MLRRQFRESRWRWRLSPTPQSFEYRRQSRFMRPRRTTQLQYRWSLFLPRHSAAGEHLGKGWRISTIYTALSGRPFSVLVGGGTDNSGQGLIGDSLRAAWDGTPIKYNTRNPNQY